MKIVSGVDIVYLPRFKRSLKKGGENFLRRVFHETELRRHLLGEQRRHLEGDVQHLAGSFAAKEAVMKALSFPPGSWHKIQIDHLASGAPIVKFTPPIPQISQNSLSISHDGSYVIAQFVAIIK